MLLATQFNTIHTVCCTKRGRGEGEGKKGGAKGEGRGARGRGEEAPKSTPAFC